MTIGQNAIATTYQESEDEPAHQIQPKSRIEVTRVLVRIFDSEAAWGQDNAYRNPESTV